MFECKRKKGLFTLWQWVFLVYFLFLLSGQAVLVASEKISKKITVVYSIDCVPFHFQNNKKRPDGIIIDKWKLFSKKTGIKIKFIPAVWQDTLKMVKSGRADAHAGLFFSTQRDAYLDYGPPLLTSDTHIFWDKRLPAPTGENAFNPFCVGVLKADFAQLWLQANMPNLRLIAFNSNNEMMSSIRQNKILVFVADTLTALHYLQEYDLRTRFKFKPNAPIYKNDFFPAVKQGDKELLKVIKDGMEQIKSSESRQIARKWATGQKRSDTDSLIISMDRNFPPMTMMDSQGNPTGLLVEMWQLWSRKTQIPITFRPSSRKRSVEAVKNGEADIHSGLFKNDERSQWMAFSIPIHRSETALFFNNSDPDFSLADLADYRVGVLSGSYQANYLTRQFPKILTIPESDGEALIHSLLNADVAAIFHETMTVEADLNRLGLLGRLKKGTMGVINNALYAGVAKQNKKVLDLINKGFADIEQNKLAEIENRWIPRKGRRFYSATTKELVLNEEEKLFLANHSPLRFSEINWRPMSIVDRTNKFDGIIADYLDLITQRSGLRFKFTKSDTWDQVLQKYVNGNIDVVPAIERTDEIGRRILISNCYVRFPCVIATLDNGMSIPDLTHLKNKKVGAGKGYTSYNYLKSNYPDIELVPTDDVKSGLLMLSSRKISAFVGHMAVVSNCIKENGLTNLKIAGEAGYSLEHCIGVDPGYPLAVSIINKVLNTMNESDHQKIYNRWLSVHYQKGINYSLVFKVIFGAAFLVVFVLYWNRKLSREVTERKLTEQRLMENERKTRAMSEAIHDGLVMIDENAKVMYWNQAAEKLFGIHAKDAMGKDLHILIAPEQYIEKANKGLMAFAKNGLGEMVGNVQEFTARHNNGKTFPVEVGVSAFQMKDHWYAVGTIRDITDRLRTQETVNEIRAELQQIFDNTHVGLLLLKDSNQVQRCNERTAQILGYDSPRQMCGINLSQLHLSTKKYNAFIEKCYFNLTKGEQVLMEYQLKKKDTTAVWCSLAGKALDTGTPADLNKGVIWAIDDITEKRKTRKALKESEKRIKTILDSINTGTIIIAPRDRTIVDVNPVAAKMIGLPRDRIAGQPGDQFISPKQMHSYPATASDDQTDNAEWELMTTNGTKIPILNAVVPVVLDEQKMLLHSFVDLTSQKEAEKELHQNLKELERFYKMAIDREEKMIDLKAEVNGLLKGMGQKEKYIVR